jgi:anti-sigma-K factor RskA
MSNEDIHGRSGAYVGDAVDGPERAQFEAHLADCSPCRDEVASLRAGAGRLALGTATSPAPSLRDSAAGKIDGVRPLLPVVDTLESPAPFQRPVPLQSSRRDRAGRPRGPGRLLAAAVAAAIVIAGAAWHLWSQAQPQVPEQGRVQLAAPQQVLQARDARRFETKVGAATAMVVRSASLNKAVIATSNLPAAPQGKAYELWLRQGKTMVAAGFIPGGGSSTVLLQGDAATAAAAGITIEPVGGSLAPSLPLVALVALP